ncbi:MAG: YqjF family protein [Bryobacteraceae bacterium]
MPLAQSISEYPIHRVKWPVMHQRWNSLTFLHWRYQPEDVRPLLPSRLELDTFDGAAWIGLTPFLLSGLRVPLLPAAPWISRFPEMNVRTYVRGPDGERGIWFFTLEADRLAAVLGARLSYGLPYRWADMRVRDHGGSVEYRSKRHVGRGTADILVLRNSALRAKEQELFLTARFRLYTTIAGRLAFAQVEHPPWPLESASVLRLEQDVIENSGVPKPEGKPLVHFSPGTAVRVGQPKLVRR